MPLHDLQTHGSEPTDFQSVPASCSALLDLPTELKLQICLLLPAIDIVRLRLVHRVLHDFVGINVQHIYSIVHNRELFRLREFINYYVTYEGDVTILEALSRWARLRGWAITSMPPDNAIGDIARRANEDSIRKFSSHWTPLKKYPDLSQQAHADTFVIAQRLWAQDQYFQGHVPQASDPQIAWLFELETFVRLVRACARNAPGFSEAECIVMYNELRDTPGGRLSGPRRKVRGDITPAPRPPGLLPATESAGFRATFANDIYRSDTEPMSLLWTPIPLCTDEWSGADLKELRHIIGVPALSWTNQFTYVVESEWARRTLHEILRMHRKGVVVDRLMLAAGMEELRIF